MSAAPLVRSLVATGRPRLRLSESRGEALRRFLHKLSTGEYRLEEASCACGESAQSSVLIASEDRYGLPLKTYLCRACGLLFTTPRLDQASVVRFYAEDYRPLYKGSQRATEGFFERQAEHGEQIISRLRGHLPSHGRVFDIGCGAGGTLLPFLKAGWASWGCDLGGDYLERGRQAGLSLLRGGYDALSGHAPTDLVIASHVLEHCRDPLRELAGWRGLLGTGGLLYVEVPGVFDLYNKYGRIETYFHLAHNYHFTLRSLEALAARTGLRLLDGDESVWALFALAEPTSLDSSGIAGEIERFLSARERAGARATRALQRSGARLARSIRKRARS